MREIKEEIMRKRFEPDQYEDELLTREDLRNLGAGMVRAAVILAIPTIAFLYWLLK
jgi:hypothetical protein